MDTAQWLAIEFPSTMFVTSIGTKGGSFLASDSFVSAYRILCSADTDGEYVALRTAAMHDKVAS